jgi:hypothetical protein
MCERRRASQDGLRSTAPLKLTGFRAGVGLAKMKLKLQARGSISRFVVIPRNEGEQSAFGPPLEIMDIEDTHSPLKSNFSIGKWGG